MINYKEVFAPVADMIESGNYSYEGAYTDASGLRDRWYNGKLTKNEESRNLRMDWELSDKVTADEKEVARLMLGFFEEDLKDLIKNGDVLNNEDPLLNTFDGEIKRGQKAVEVKLLAAHLEVEPKPKKETVEYTLYFRPYVRFE